MPVCEVGHGAFVATVGRKHLVAENLSLDLHKRHVASEVGYAVNLGAVHIFIRIILQQVTPGLDAELTYQCVFLVWAYARKIHDVL